MAHKTITISEEAYNALAKVKGEKESFTDVILRIARKKGSGNLLDYVRSLQPDEELARTLEEIVQERKKISLPAPQF
ncbi:antitoxin VapB family protein [Candidatus Bathyarchaeota archaeon]|nr:antitoxin VapB family protein [Candidatus Bathyarchaeota archaeon]